MKTATLLSLFLISFLSTTLIAQNRSETVNITWGEEEKGSRQLFVSELIDADEEHVLVMKRSLKTYKTFKPGQIIARYDQDMRLDVEKELVLETNKRERELSFTTNLNDGIQVFSSFNNSKLKKHFLFVENIDKKTLSPTSSLVKIAEIDYTGNSRYRIGNFDGVLSRDESKLLVYYNLPYQKKAKEKFGFHVFDQQMNLIWNRNVTLPYRDDLFAIKDYEVDNEGNVFILGQVFTSSKHVGKGKNSKPNYKYVVLSYSSDGENLKVYPIQVQAKFLKDMKMALDTDNNILCGGFYSMLNRGNVKGSFFLKIDADSKEITSKTFKAFGIDFITQNMSKGVAKRNKNRNSKGKNVELYDYNFDDIVLDKNGNVFLIGEQFYSYSQTVTSTNTSGLTKSSTIHYFIYNDIIVVKMSPEGVVLDT
ncbi:MAG: hypothetical protein ACPGEC_02000 [Flavobacteriales bacterium]